MKKFASLLVLALLLLTAAVVSADPPLGVAPAVGVDWPFCFVYYGDSHYEGSATMLYSNSATGHATWQCDAELVSGTPVHDQWKGEFLGCASHFVLAGQNARWSAQCFDWWYP
jgi:hypothetical protein